MSTLKGDLYSNLIGEIELTMRIESRLGHRIFTTGESFWWYNSEAKVFRPTKSLVKPLPFLGNSNYILLARSIDGYVMEQDEIVERYING